MLQLSDISKLLCDSSLSFSDLKDHVIADKVFIHYVIAAWRAYIISQKETRSMQSNIEMQNLKAKLFKST